MQLEQNAFFRYLYAPLYAGPRSHVTICYLKKGQSPPQGNGPFFDPISAFGYQKKRDCVDQPSHAHRILAPPFHPYSFVSIGFFIHIYLILKTFITFGCQVLKLFNIDLFHSLSGEQGWDRSGCCTWYNTPRVPTVTHGYVLDSWYTKKKIMLASLFIESRRFILTVQ